MSVQSLENPPVRRASRMMWTLVGFIALFCAISWMAVATVMILRFDVRICTAVAVVAALSLEALFWSTAAALGVKVFEARRAIWRLITTGRLRQA